MSKFLRVPDGDYKIQVREGGRITLDTGIERGQVYITGNLIVEGDTTTVNSENVVVRDNIIELNKDDPSTTGITLGESGLLINRGISAGYPDAKFVFDENVEWTDPVSETTKYGAFRFTNVNNADIGIRTNSIATGGQDLYLINSGTGVLSVTGTNNYERQVFYYLGPNEIDINAGSNGDGTRDPDIIPNAKCIADYITSFFAGQFQDAISEGITSPTQVEVQDFEVTGSPSQILFEVDGTLVASMHEGRLELNDIRISRNKIETTVSNTDLILSSPGTGTVRVQDTLGIYAVPTVDDPDQDLLTPGVQYVPGVPDSGVNLYVTTRNTGGSGIYFVHEDTTRDEIISNNRALVYGMIF